MFELIGDYMPSRYAETLSVASVCTGLGLLSSSIYIWCLKWPSLVLDTDSVIT